MLKDMQITVDRLFAKILVAQWLFGIACAWMISPLSWNGSSSSVHVHVWAAIWLGGLILGAPLLLVLIAPGRLFTRLAVSSGQLMFSALLIHLMGGRIEAHFHIFVSLALLAAYRDRTVFIPAVVITITDHLVRGFLWPQSVFGVFFIGTWRPLEHGAWVIFEALSLCYLIGQNLSQFVAVASLQFYLQEQRDELEQNVSERTKDLQIATAFQECILNSIDAEICIVNESGEILFVNDRWQNLSACNSGDVQQTGVGINYLDACDRDHGPQVQNSMEIAKAIRQVRDGQITAYVNEYPSHHGDRKQWFHVRVNPVLLNGVRAIALVHINVTESKQAQARAESLAKLVLDSPDEVYIFSKETLQFVEVNHGACKNSGFDRETLLTMSPLDIQVDSSKESFLELLKHLLKGDVETVNCETLHQRKDGSTYQCSINFHTSILEDVEVIVAFVTDVTHRKRLEEQLAQAQKLESVGQLAAGVAHEINTPMQCVFGNVEFLETSFEKLMALSDHVVTMLEKSDLDWSEERNVIEELRGKYRYDHLRQQTPLAIKEATDASSKVISIIRAMKIMSHPGSKEKTPVDLHDMIRSAATLTRGRWKYVAELEFNFDANLHPVSVFPAEMSQVFINLLVNAADAISDKIGEEPSELGKIKVSTQIDHDWVKIAFSDTGIGMSAIVRKRIFDPFFTTKEIGKGTGQGLSISHNVIVKHHSGTIEVKSVEGVGTTLVVRIPRFATSDNDLRSGVPITTNGFPNINTSISSLGSV